MASGLGVEPLQTAVMPPDVEAQHVAAALKDVLSKLLDLDGLIRTVHQTVAGKAITVMFARLVETPVLGYAEGGVVVALHPKVSLRGALRRRPRARSQAACPARK